MNSSFLRLGLCQHTLKLGLGKFNSFHIFFIFSDFETLFHYRSFDISMWEIQNGKEREVGDWAALFQAADPRLKLTNFIQPRGSKLGIIEARWDM